MCKCLICEKELKNRKSLSQHLRLHEIKLLDYYIKYEDFKIPKCPYCKKECYTRSTMKFNKTCGDKDCKKRISKTKTLSNETRKKISEKRKKWLKENPEKHNWKNNEKFKSIPCEKFKDILKNKNIDYIEEFTPEESDRFFSFDIVIVNKKLGIEINGNQHYCSDGTLKEYYKERSFHLKSLGWEIIEVPYYKVYDEEFINIIIDYIENKNIIYNNEETIKIIDKYTIKEKKINKKRICKCGNIKDYKSKNCKNCRVVIYKVERPPYDVLLIDIANYSYVKVGKKYGVSDNTIRDWIKKYEKDIL